MTKYPVYVWTVKSIWLSGAETYDRVYIALPNLELAKRFIFEHVKRFFPISDVRRRVTMNLLEVIPPVKPIWLVQLQYRGFENVWSRVVCACDSEEAAHAAGKKVADYYNYPDYDFCDTLAGVTLNMIDYYHYAVKKHEGEWI